MTGVKKKVEIYLGIKIGGKHMWKHPSYYAKIKKENRLTNSKNYDKEINNEKIQSKDIRNGDRRSSNNTIRQRARHKHDRE